jgi:hypothetical protein
MAGAALGFTMEELLEKYVLITSQPLGQNCRDLPKDFLGVFLAFDIQDLAFSYQFIESIFDNIISFEQNISKLILESNGLKFSVGDALDDVQDRRGPADAPANIQPVPDSTQTHKTSGSHKRYPSHVNYQRAVGDDSEDMNIGVQRRLESRPVALYSALTHYNYAGVDKNEKYYH